MMADIRHRMKNCTKERNRLFLETLGRLTGEIKDITRAYMQFVDVGEYKGDDSHLVQDIWFELFDGPVSEACREAVEEWTEEEG